MLTHNPSGTLPPLEIPLKTQRTTITSPQYTHISIHRQWRIKDTGKKQINMNIWSSVSYISQQMSVLSYALNRYTKKTGAFNKLTTSGNNDEDETPMNGIMRIITSCMERIQIVMSVKQALVDIRMQMFLLSPWIAQFDRLLSNVIRILNDRAAMLWRRNAYVPLERACMLHQDVTSISNILNKVLTIFSPRQVTVAGTPCLKSSGSFTNEPQSYLVDSQLCPLVHQVITRMRFHLSRTVPLMYTHVEKLIVKRLSDALSTTISSCLHKNSFQGKRRSRELTLGSTVRDNLLQPVLTSVKAHCRAQSSIERIMTAATNCCIDRILAFIKEKRLRFNEVGVFALSAQLDCLLQWVLRAKSFLGLPPSARLVIDVSPWLRANGIMHILLAATSGMLPDSTDSSDKTRIICRHLTIFEQERWAELGAPKSLLCVKMPVMIALKRRGAAVSISVSLDIRDI
mmetsp:Transcript_9345/g.14093  ORF Transcript_9345/g.14093 Transcript_9345/m.14093 type:complete len:457 (-) Transcript_9345:304-1674(-)